MPEKNTPLELSFAESIKETTPQDWEAVFGKDLIEGYGYQKTLEDACLREFSFGYLLAKRKEKITAIIPLFSMDFSLDTLVDGAIHKYIAKFKDLLTVKILFVGSPTTEEFYLGLHPDESLKEIMDGALEKLSAFCRKNKIIGTAFYNLSAKNKALADYLKRKNFIEMKGLPTTRMEIGAGSLEGYVSGLGKNTRKDLKKKLKNSAQLATLRTEERLEIEDIYPQVYKLYLNNFNEGDVHFETLTPDFFRDICKNMPGVARYFITYDKEKIVAFNLCLVKGDLLIDKFIGFDHEVYHQYHLYFTTIVHNIEWCIKNKIRYYQPGVTDYPPKIRMGAKLVPLYIYARGSNIFVDSLIRILSPFIQPKNLEPDLKEIEKQEKKKLLRKFPED